MALPSSEEKYLVCCLHRLPNCVDQQLPDIVQIYNTDKEKLLGRSADNDIIATSNAISHYHMKLEIVNTRPASGYALAVPAVTLGANIATSLSLPSGSSSSSSSSANFLGASGKNNALLLPELEQTVNFMDIHSLKRSRAEMQTLSSLTSFPTSTNLVDQQAGKTTSSSTQKATQKEVEEAQRILASLALVAPIDLSASPAEQLSATIDRVIAQRIELSNTAAVDGETSDRESQGGGNIADESNGGDEQTAGGGEHPNKVRRKNDPADQGPSTSKGRKMKGKTQKQASTTAAANMSSSSASSTLNNKNVSILDIKKEQTTATTTNSSSSASSTGNNKKKSSPEVYRLQLSRACKDLQTEVEILRHELEVVAEAKWKSGLPTSAHILSSAIDSEPELLSRVDALCAAFRELKRLLAEADQHILVPGAAQSSSSSKNAPPVDNRPPKKDHFRSLRSGITNNSSTSSAAAGGARGVNVRNSKHGERNSTGASSVDMGEPVNNWLRRERMRNNMHVFLRDTSTYGTYVNGIKIGRNTIPRMLKNGDVIAFMRHDERAKEIGDYRVEYAPGHSPLGGEIVAVELPLFTGNTFSEWARQRESVQFTNMGKQAILNCYRVCLTTFLMCSDGGRGHNPRLKELKQNLPQECRNRILDFLRYDSIAEAVGDCKCGKPPRAELLKAVSNTARERHMDDAISVICNNCAELAKEGLTQMEIPIKSDADLASDKSLQDWQRKLRGDLLKHRRFATKLKDLGYQVEVKNGPNSQLTVKWGGGDEQPNNRGGRAGLILRGEAGGQLIRGGAAPEHQMVNDMLAEAAGMRHIGAAAERAAAAAAAIAAAADRAAARDIRDR
ncbi:unnamed protein product [Amoebophrya sp. A25]|nr:unnamed protein product [Amoebophrya sp. A25]|eukprot:GSA25T00014410001.1